MKDIVTNNGKKGGWLKGKPHYDKNGKPLGGIKAIVTDTGKEVELEGGEVIINKHASALHWKELSKINQSAGGGVAIGPPSISDEDPEEYKEGGRVIEFNPNHIPNNWILSYAKKIKKQYPKVWDLGGNIFGNKAFENLERVAKRGYWLDDEKWMYIKWRSYVARHKGDFRIEGVIAMLKWVDKVNKGWPYMKDLIENEIEKRYKAKGGSINEEEEVKDRWAKKKEHIEILANNIQKLRYNITKDLSSNNEKVFLTALVISVMDNTGERVGNNESASNGHFGITGLQKKHIKINGNTITLTYVGKSNVSHETRFTNEKIAKALKDAINKSKSKLVFETSDGFQIKNDRINRYLSKFNVTAKDIRGYSANKWVTDKLKNITPAVEEKDRKKQFNEILKKVAQQIGHGKATLQKHYLIPELETSYIDDKKIIDIKQLGGEIMQTGGELEKGIKTELEHKKTVEKIAKQGLTAQQSAKLIAKDHLKEDSKYYTKLQNMENKFAQGGTVEIGSEVIQIGDKVTIKGKSGIRNIQITNITKAGWVIFTDLTDNKRKDTPIDSFKKNYLGKISNTTTVQSAQAQPTQSKPTTKAKYEVGEFVVTKTEVDNQFKNGYNFYKVKDIVVDKFDRFNYSIENTYTNVEYYYLEHEIVPAFTNLPFKIGDKVNAVNLGDAFSFDNQDEQLTITGYNIVTGTIQLEDEKGKEITYLKHEIKLSSFLKVIASKAWEIEKSIDIQPKFKKFDTVVLLKDANNGFKMGYKLYEVTSVNKDFSTGEFTYHLIDTVSKKNTEAIKESELASANEFIPISVGDTIIAEDVGGIYGWGIGETKKLTVVFFDQKNNLISLVDDNFNVVKLASGLELSLSGALRLINEGLWKIEKKSENIPTKPQEETKEFIAQNTINSLNTWIQYNMKDSVKVTEQEMNKSTIDNFLSVLELVGEND